MRVIPGKLVINVVPDAAPSKGDALVALRDRTEADIAMYVGDDVTDEDVFRLDQPEPFTGGRPLGTSRRVRTCPQRNRALWRTGLAPRRRRGPNSADGMGTVVTARPDARIAARSLDFCNPVATHPRPGTALTRIENSIG